MIGIVLIMSCKKNDNPTPITNNPITIVNTDSNYVEYYLDGVKQVPTIVSASILFNKFSFIAIDSTNIDEATSVQILFDSSTTIGVYVLPDTSEVITAFNYLALLIGQGSGQQSLAYYSSMCNNRNNNNAFFEITDLDYNASLMSGTFEGKVGSYSIVGNSTEHVITGGIFTNVPFIH